MVKTYYKILFSLFILLISCGVYAQDLDSLSVIDSKYDSILRSDGGAMNVLFYKHDNDILINNLGPFGSPYYYPTAFYLQKKNLLEKPNEFNSKLYKLSGFRPYTNITYINASRKEQQFSIKHIQEFGKLLLFDFDFKKVSSPGAYVNQEANNTFFKANLSYKSKNNNYEVKFSNEIYRNFYQENGGLLNVIDYEERAFDDDQNYPVNLMTSNSFKKSYSYKLTQLLDLFKFKSDSNNTRKVYLKHQTTYQTQQKVFFDNDPLSNIYNNLYLDSLSSVDSIYTNNYSNTGFIGFRNKTYAIELFGQYDLKKYEQNFGVNADYHNSYIGLLGKYANNKLQVDAFAKYGASGYRIGDIESELAVTYDKDKYIIKGGATYFLTEPDLKHIYYNSNHFIWANTTFEKQSTLGFNIAFKLKKKQLEFKAESKLLNNTIYYDSLAIVSQNENNASITSFSLAKDYKLLNFHFRTAFIYQVTSDEFLFPLPAIIARQVVYYQKDIFKGNLQFQFGAGVSYSTDYYGYAYMPAINEFHVQQNTFLGNYPKLDVFINTHLKRAQIFLKYEHINAGSNLQKSYVTLGYPPMAKSLKFGVSWNVFD